MVKIKKGQLIISIVILLLLLYALTYIPHKIINANPDNISKIVVFNGSTGKQIMITEDNNIEHIISNLNKGKFKKGELALGTGYRYKVTIYNNKGKVIKRLIINSEDTIRYNGFFYRAKNNNIDFQYISSLFH